MTQSLRTDKVESFYSGVPKVGYDRTLSLSQAEQVLREIKGAFLMVQEHYWFTGWIRRNMREKDKKTLDDCVGALLPLSVQKSVQEEVVHKPHEQIQATAHRQSIVLFEQIALYLSRFRNTGVRILYERPEALFD